MYSHITRLVVLFFSVVLFVVDLFAAIKGYEINPIGFMTGFISIVLLIPWYNLKKPFDDISELNEASKKPEFVAVGVIFFLVTVWLWV